MQECRSMAKTKYLIQTDLKAVTINMVAHDALQKMRGGKKGVLFGKHVPDLKLMSASIDWTYDKKSKKADGIKTVTMDVRYWGTVFLSKAIDKKSTCFKLVKAHELEHESICAKGVKAMNGACAKILEKHVEAMLKKFKGDYDAFEKAGDKAARKVFIAAYKEIDDGPFLAVATKSAGIDTPANYKKISPHCEAYG